MLTLQKSSAIRLLTSALLLTTSLVLSSTLEAQPSDKPSHQWLLDKGESLFVDPALSESPTDKSCQTCHQDGTGIEFACDNPKIIQQINRCITAGLKGLPLDPNSVEMRALKTYTCSFGED